MDSFAGDRDYSLDYREGSNKCDFVRMAVESYDSSSQDKFRKYRFITVLEVFCVALEDRREVAYPLAGMDGVVGLDLLYDLAYLVHKAFDILRTTEDWELKSGFDDAVAAAELEGVAFQHALKDVPDAFDFVVGAAYRDWFYHHEHLLGLYRDGGGEVVGRGSLLTVDEEFVCQWEDAYMPDSEHQAPFGYWSYHVGAGWQLDGYDNDN